LANTFTPLPGAVVVPHLLTRCDQVATRPSDTDQDLRLSRERRRGRLVETPHPLAQIALADQRLPLERQPDHLELRHPAPPPWPPRARRESPGGGRVPVHEHRGPVPREPAVIGPRLELVQEAVTALQPAVGNGGLAAELKAVGGEPGGDPRRRRAVT